jgi:hypothetical protein
MMRSRSRCKCGRPAVVRCLKARRDGTRDDLPVASPPVRDSVNARNDDCDLDLHHLQICAIELPIDEYHPTCNLEGSCARAINFGCKECKSPAPWRGAMTTTRQSLSSLNHSSL